MLTTTSLKKQISSSGRVLATCFFMTMQPCMGQVVTGGRIIGSYVESNSMDLIQRVYKSGNIDSSITLDLERFSVTSPDFSVDIPIDRFGGHFRNSGIGGAVIRGHVQHQYEDYMQINFRGTRSNGDTYFFAGVIEGSAVGDLNESIEADAAGWRNDFNIRSFQWNSYPTAGYSNYSTYGFDKTGYGEVKFLRSGRNVHFNNDGRFNFSKWDGQPVSYIKFDGHEGYDRYIGEISVSDEYGVVTTGTRDLVYFRSLKGGVMLVSRLSFNIEVWNFNDDNADAGQFRDISADSYVLYPKKVLAGKVISVIGSAKVLGVDDEYPETGKALQKGDLIYEGESIVTAKSSVCRVKMNAGSVMTIAPKSRIKVEEYPEQGNKVIRLIVGGLRDFVKTEGPDLTIKSRTATIGVRGTAVSDVFQVFF